MTIATIVLIIASAAHFFIGVVAYVRDTLLGSTQPNRMTFLIWAAGPAVAVAVGLAEGGSWALLPVFVSGFGPLCIFLASFVNPRAYWKLGPLDYVCGALAVCALVAWRLTSDALVAISLAAAADFLAFVPTGIKAWRFPDTETGQTFAVALLSVLVGMSVSNHNLPEMLFLMVLFVENLFLVIAIFRKRARVLFGSCVSDHTTR